MFIVVFGTIQIKSTGAECQLERVGALEGGILGYIDELITNPKQAAKFMNCIFTDKNCPEEYKRLKDYIMCLMKSNCADCGFIERHKFTNYLDAAQKTCPVCVKNMRDIIGGHDGKKLDSI